MGTEALGAKRDLATAALTPCYPNRVTSLASTWSSAGGGIAMQGDLAEKPQVVYQETPFFRLLFVFKRT